MKRLAYLKLVFLLLNVIVSGPLFADTTAQIPSPIMVGEAEFTSGDFTLAMYADATLEATVEDVTEGKLKPQVISSRFSLPIEKANYWFAFTLKNQTNESIDRLIIIDEPFLYNVDLYYQDDLGNWVVEKNGVAVPVFERVIPTRLPHFAVHLQANESRPIYLFVSTKHHLVSFAIEVTTPALAKQHEQLKIAGYWLFFGVLLAMLIYNSFLFVLLRDKLYFYYSLYCFTFFMFVMQYSGFHLLIVKSVFVHYALATFVPLSLGFLTVFIGQLLQSKQYLPKINLCLRGLSVIFFIEALLTFINTDYYFFTLLLAMPATFFLFSVSLYAFIKKIPLANYLLFGMSWHVLGLFTIAGVNLGLLEYNFISRYGFILGSLIELFVFSLALAYRVRLLQKQKNEYHDELIAFEQKEKNSLMKQVFDRDQELAIVQNKIIHLQKMDPLTGLFNRNSFDLALYDQWQAAPLQGELFSVVLLEFNQFSYFCEHYGQQTGDYSLRLIAQSLIRTVGISAEMVARFSDNKFALLLPNLDKQATALLVDELQATIVKLKIPFKETKAGKVECIFVSDEIHREKADSSSQWIDKLDEQLNQQGSDDGEETDG